jgi:hypothetical protein
MSHQAESWLQLFPPAPAGAAATSLKFRLMRKRGEPLLLIPADARLADASLSLYPAQTWRGRLARLLVALSIHTRLPVLTEPMLLAPDLQSPFLKFVATPAPTAALPRFAMLFGNPNATGRRFIMLVFDRSGRPEKVIKVGQGADAGELIRREAGFMKTISGKLSGIPKLLGDFESTGVRAVALEYIAGRTANAGDLSSVAEVLAPWLDREHTVEITELPAWQRLRLAAGADELFRRAEKSLSGMRVHPAILHGDFAPWNIRVHPATQKWVVLDWERGELAGPPAWDWFHFVIQPALLVAKLSAAGLADKVERFVNSPEFSGYAACAGIKTQIRPLLLAYLLYCREVLKPSEGKPATTALLELLRQRWRPL